MGKKNKITFSVCFVLFNLLNTSCLNFPDLGVCENSAEKIVISPNEKLKVVIFDRGCGATVGFITGISIVPTNEKVQNNDTANVLFAENIYREFSTDKNGQTRFGKTNFDVEWINDKELLVFYSESRRIYKKESYDNIKIKYELISK